MPFLERDIGKINAIYSIFRKTIKIIIDWVILHKMGPIFPTACAFARTLGVFQLKLVNLARFI